MAEPNPDEMTDAQKRAKGWMLIGETLMPPDVYQNYMAASAPNASLSFYGQPPSIPTGPSSVDPNAAYKETAAAPSNPATGVPDRNVYLPPAAPGSGTQPEDRDPNRPSAPSSGINLPDGYGTGLYDLNNDGHPDNLPSSSGPHPSDPSWVDINGDGKPDGVPPGLTGLPTGPADTLPPNPGWSGTDAGGTINWTKDENKNGIPDDEEAAAGSGSGGTGTPPRPLNVQSGTYGQGNADLWAQTLASQPQLGWGGNGQMGWGGAMTTGVGAPISLDGYGGGGGGGSGGNFSLPGGATGTGTGGFQMPDFNPPAFTDVSGIGTTTSGTGSPSTGGTGGTGFQFPDFQSPSTTTGTTTGTTSPLAGYGSAPSTGTPNAGLVQNLAGSYQQQIDAANASNESRYGTGLEMLLKRYEQAGQSMLGLTNEGIADIGRLYERQRASMDQGLIDRGLANTTVRSAIDRGYTTDQAQAERRYWDDQVRKNLDEQFRQTGAITDWIGGRNDVAPSTGDLANLASGVGSAGPGASTTTGTPSTTTSTGVTGSAAAPAPVNLPPQVTTALQNGTLGSLAATQPGVNPAGTTPSSGFLNQGANITTPEQLSASVNGGGTTRAQTAAPPPPSSPLAGYGSTTTPLQTDAQKLDAATAAFKQQVAERYNPTALAGQLSRAANPSGSTPQFATGVMFNSGPKYLSTGGDAALFADAETNTRAPTETKQFGQYAVPVAKTATQGGSPPGSTDYKLPSGYSGETAQNPNGVGTITAPPSVSGGAVWGGSKNPTTPDYVSMPGGSSPMPPPPPSSPSVMGFPDPQGTGMAPGNPNDVTNAMRAQNPNNPQLSSGFRPPETANPAYGGTPGMASMSSPLAGYGREPNMPKQANPSTTSYGSGFGQSFTMPSAPATPNPGVVPQRPEPVPFNTAATPPASPLSGYGTTPPGMPSFMAPPGPTPAPTFQQMGVPGTQYKPPSLVGGVTMPQPPARRWGV